MSNFTSLSQMVNSAVNKAKSQQRIIEREIKTDGETPWKLKKLEKAQSKEELASNYFAQALEQDSENAKTFMDSVKETIDKINEEAKKKEEEKAAENTKETSQNNNVAEGGQNTGENNEPGAIVDVVIPATVVSTGLSSNKNKDEQAAVFVDVSA